MKVYKIYKLIHNGSVVYIGKTINSFSRRRQSGYKSNDELDKIINQCVYELIEETTDATRESYYISHYRSLGYTLLNIQRGYVDIENNKTEYNRNYYDNIKRYRERNKEFYKEYAKDYVSRPENVDRIKEYQKEYQKKYRDKKKNKV